MVRRHEEEDAQTTRLLNVPAIGGIDEGGAHHE